ncbi:unnamed protein product [Rhizophagus irregularis]|nr:unnamed protein product [Rhizophagus irregularis]
MLFRYTREEVAKHNTTSDLWIIHNNKVYDVTEFAMDHPGGPELIKEWGGKDVTKTLIDPISHEHSETAYEILGDLCIGEIVEGPNNNNTLNSMDNKILLLIDLMKKLINFIQKTLMLILISRKKNFLTLIDHYLFKCLIVIFSKEFYLKQIHQPRHLPYSAKLFENPWLELLTKTPCILFLIGIVMWTLLEYGIHRFLFHVDAILPDHPYALCVHFTLHGIHHYLPMDKLRLFQLDMV